MAKFRWIAIPGRSIRWSLKSGSYGVKLTYLKVIWIEKDWVGDVKLSRKNVWNDVSQPEDVIVVAEGVPVGTQLLVAQLWPLVLNSDVVDYLKSTKTGLNWLFF